MKLKKIISIFLVYLMCLNNLVFIYANQEKESKIKNTLDNNIEKERPNLKTYDNDDIVSQDGFVFDLSTGTIIDYESSTDENLELIIPSEIMAVRVDAIGEYAFGRLTNTNLISIVIPEGITTIEERAFSHCKGIKTINIPKSITNIDSTAFSLCSELTSINVDKKNNYYCDDDGVLFNKDKTELIRFPEGKNIYSYSIPIGVKYIKDYAFEYCTNLINIDIPNSVTYIDDLAFTRR